MGPTPLSHPSPQWVVVPGTVSAGERSLEWQREVGTTCGRGRGLLTRRRAARLTRVVGTGPAAGAHLDLAG